MKFLIVFLLTLVSPLAISEQNPQTVSVPESSLPESGAPESKTVFVDVSAFNRRKGAAEKLTELYAEEAASGWRLLDLELYIEDNDLEGFFVTFQRKALDHRPEE